MQYVLFNGETSVNDLATRVFQPQGPNAAATTTEAASALLKANPQLSDLTKVPVGSLIAIPDNTPVIPVNQQAAGSSALRAQAAQTMQDALDTLQQRLTDIETSAATRLKTVTDLIQSADIKTGVQAVSTEHQELTKLVPNLDNAAKAAATMTQSVQAAQGLRKTSLAQASASLATFAKK